MSGKYMLLGRPLEFGDQQQIEFLNRVKDYRRLKVSKGTFLCPMCKSRFTLVDKLGGVIGLLVKMTWMILMNAKPFFTWPRIWFSFPIQKY